MKKYITTNPEIAGGQPCIAGTRITVSLFLTRLKQGQSLKEFQEMYHWVPLATLEGMLEELAQQVNHPSYEQQPAQTQTTAR